MSCSNKVKQLTLALHNYLDSYQAFPAGTSGMGEDFYNDRSDETNGTERLRIDVLLPLLPYVEQTALYEGMTEQQRSSGGLTIGRNEPNSASSGNAFRNIAVTFAVCPSEGRPDVPEGFWGRNNMIFSQGDFPGRCYSWPGSTGQNVRGPFVERRWMSMGTLVDGTSNTAAVSERVMAMGSGKEIASSIAINQW